MVNCQVCGKNVSPKKLRRHTKFSCANPVEFIKCDFCPKTFNRPDNVLKHTRKYHTLQVRAFDDALEIHEMNNLNLPQDLIHFWEANFQKMKKTLLTKPLPIKNQIVLNILFKRLEEIGDTEFKVFPFLSVSEILSTENQIENFLRRSYSKINESVEQFLKTGSGFVYVRIVSFKFTMSLYRPFAAGYYMPTPEPLYSTKGIVNVQNDDNKCFLWAILSALHPVKEKAHRVSHYKCFENELNTSTLKYPVSFDQISSFEELNHLSVNVFTYNKELKPLYITENRSAKTIPLLLIRNGDDCHYCWIKDFSRVVSHLTNHNGKYFVCPYCLHRFTSEMRKEEHVKYCKENNFQPCKFPDRDSFQFVQYQHGLKHPYVIYADFECFQTIPFSVCSYAYVVVDSEGQIFDTKFYCGKEPVYHFLTEMQVLDKQLSKLKNINIPLKMTDDDLKQFKSAKYCHICSRLLGDDKVQDHDHRTGKFRNAAHSNCNLKYKYSPYIPVLFHNLKGFDGHFIVKELGKFPNTRINCIPENSEKYLSITFGNIRFLDSFMFLNRALDSIPIESYNILPQYFSRYLPNYFNRWHYLKSKLTFPYKYLTDENRLLSTSLPGKIWFEKDFEKVKELWNVFGIERFEDYLQLYNTTDVLLLADIFENFRKMCMTEYKLDPCYYFSSSGLSFSACLKMTSIQLEYIKDIDMHLLVERSIRGGINLIAKRYAKTTSGSTIMYFDSNNLYGFALMQHLPYGGFKWVQNIDVLSIPDDSCKGYFVEVDLKYDNDLHDLHNEYPLAPENDKGFLLPNLRDKSHYVVHYRLLKLYVELGLKITKIHKILEFDQKPWLKPYIEHNTENRKNATSSFHKDFFKLMNNSVYGKTLENKRKRIIVKLVTNKRKYLKLVASPNFHSVTLLSKNFAAVQMRYKSILLDKPIYVGATVLELSKLHMYQFFYKFLKPVFNVTLLFTDTDSLCVEIPTADIYQKLQYYSDYFDFSNYPKDHFLYNTRNRLVPGKFKDEWGSIPIDEFVGLKPKLYSIKSSHPKTAAKGIKSTFSHDDYRECLFHSQQFFVNEEHFQSKKHDVSLIPQYKLALSSNDDKRIVHDDKIHTYAYGHKYTTNLFSYH